MIQKILWCHIGSVDTLENRVQDIQHDLFIDAINQIEVVYVNQFDLDDISKILPILFMTGLTIFMLKRTSSMIGGKGGGLFGSMSIVKHVKPGEINVRFKWVLIDGCCVCVLIVCMK